MWEDLIITASNNCYTLEHFRINKKATSAVNLSLVDTIPDGNDGNVSFWHNLNHQRSYSSSVIGAHNLYDKFICKTHYKQFCGNLYTACVQVQPAST